MQNNVVVSVPRYPSKNRILPSAGNLPPLREPKLQCLITQQFSLIFTPYGGQAVTPLLSFSSENCVKKHKSKFVDGFWKAKIQVLCVKRIWGEEIGMGGSFIS